MSEPEAKEWLWIPELEKHASHTLGRRISMAGLRKYESLGIITPKTRRVASPTRANPTRTRTQYHWDVLIQLVNIRARLEEGVTLAEIARETRESRHYLEEMLAQPWQFVRDRAFEKAMLEKALEFAATKQRIASESTAKIEEDLRLVRIGFLADAYLKALPESERMTLLRVASARRDASGGTEPQEFYNRDEVLRSLGGIDLAEPKLMKWAQDRSYRPLANELSDAWKVLIQVFTQTNRLIIETIKRGEYEEALRLAVWNDVSLSPITEQIRKIPSVLKLRGSETVTSEFASPVDDTEGQRRRRRRQSNHERET